MKITRCDTLTDAIAGPYIEVRDIGGGTFLLSRHLDGDESLLTGPFPSAQTAEMSGISEAERRGIDALNIVYTAP